VIQSGAWAFPRLGRGGDRLTSGEILSAYNYHNRGML
jgi:hypothetical protein